MPVGTVYRALRDIVHIVFNFVCCLSILESKQKYGINMKLFKPSLSCHAETDVGGH